MYRKEIIYMSLYNNDIKESCIGYLKSEERQEKFVLELQIKNMPGVITGNYPIRLQTQTGWHDVGNFMLKDGNGKWTGTVTEPVLRAEIIISDICMIKGFSRNLLAAKKPEIERQIEGTPEGAGIKRQSEEPEPSDIKEAVRNESNVKTAAEIAERVPETPERAPEATVRKEPIAGGPTANRQEEQKRVEPVRYTQEIFNKRESTDSSLKAQNKIISDKNGDMAPAAVETAPIYESKWEQLLATYEQIHPYGDSRVYVKLEPKDFVILPSGYQHLVNNSFLLHGFYNYRYLILGKEKDFYIGVPGVFYEREKMVALMFGFEAFECEGGNAQEGKFGYYLRKVEL